jgi:hypothetical protein
MQFSILTLLCASLLGCSSEAPPAAPPDAGPENPSGLGVDPIPQDFTFQTTRPVAVEIETAVGGEQSDLQPRARLEVRTQTADLIFRGSVIPGEAFHFDFPLAPDVTSLEFKMIDDSGVATTRVVAVDPNNPGVSVVLGGAQ